MRFHPSWPTGPAPVHAALGLMVTGWLLLAGLSVDCQVLYDPAVGTLPGEQGWFFGGLGSATQALSNEVAVLDTSEILTTQAGYSRIAPWPLNRTNGFILSFAAQVHRATQANTNRAGFSVIVLDNERRGLELAFWDDRVFAQTDTPLFNHGEQALHPTAHALWEYALSVFETNYILRAGGLPILAGPVRDYTTFNGLFNPYRTPNFIFFGDDTTSASAAVSLGRILLLGPPTLRTSGPGTLAWDAVPGGLYAVQTSLDLSNWVEQATVTSHSGVLFYTNDVEGSARFVRLLVR